MSEKAASPHDLGNLLHQGVAHDLAVEIIDGVHPADSTMTVESIQRRFDISRTVAREVVRLLEEVRLVSSRRRVGVVLRPRRDWNVMNPTLIAWRLQSRERDAQLRSLSELRNVVEPAAAAAAAGNASVESRALLPPLAARMREFGEAGRLHEFLSLDVQFHRTVLESSGNELFGALADQVEVVLRGRTELNLMPEKPVPGALDAHEAVAMAIWEGDSAKARAAMAAITAEVVDVFSAEPEVGQAAPERPSSPTS